MTILQTAGYYLLFIFSTKLVEPATFFEVKEDKLLLIPEQANQNEALSGCLAYGGQLLMILTLEVDDKVRDMMAHAGKSSLVTSGKYNPTEKQWEWSVNSAPFDYENFETSTPNAKGYCAYKLASIRGQWRATNCTFPAEAFLCQL